MKSARVGMFICCSACAIAFSSTSRRGMEAVKYASIMAPLALAYSSELTASVMVFAQASMPTLRIPRQASNGSNGLPSLLDSLIAIPFAPALVHRLHRHPTSASGCLRHLHRRIEERLLAIDQRRHSAMNRFCHG